MYHARGCQTFQELFSHEQPDINCRFSWRHLKANHGQSSAAQSPPQSLSIPLIQEGALKARQSVPVSSSCQIDRRAPRDGPMLFFGEMTNHLRIAYRNTVRSKHLQLFAFRTRVPSTCRCVLENQDTRATKQFEQISQICSPTLGRRTAEVSKDLSGLGTTKPTLAEIDLKLVPFSSLIVKNYSS